MAEPEMTVAALLREKEELLLRLQEAEDLISAVRTGAVDALAIQGADGPRIFTLEGADQGYRTLIEQMNEGAMLLSQEGMILYGNAALAELLQQGLEDIIGTNFAAFVPADFQPSWQAIWAKGWSIGKSKGELPLRTLAGQLLPLSLSANVLQFNGGLVLACILTDLSAHHEIKAIRALVAEQNIEISRQQQALKIQEAAQQRVEQAAAEVSRLLEGIPQIAWTANSEGVSTYFNRRWFDYTGRTADQLEQAWWRDYQHPADRDAAAARWQQSLETGHVFEAEFRLLDHTGTYRWMLNRALPSYNERGELMQWIGTCTDIHEQKMTQVRIDQAQKQLQENNAQLQRANIDLDNFIYTASHDLKAPISNIEGLLHALLEELPSADDSSPSAQPVAALLTMMQDSVDRFKRTLDHLTEVTKLQKEYAAPTAWLPLSATIQDVCLDLAPLIQELGVQLEVEITDCPAVLFSEKNLRSVVYNLLSNALKYRAPDRVPHVRIWCQTTDDFLILSVQDNGLGLNLATHQHKLFAMFERFHTHVEGSGIGLYMVKKIMENAGGRIEVQSEVGVGSLFSAYFRRQYI
ncbi:PAS domain-containing sensor histidine kinase [Hymenobacter profundi]|uniref:histidine kinase n=1 Tax=Hymenobacter profundi TaxID=1982110 RepID=A0ABS6X3V2_9BACT|nr:PAS domain-containing sensor histidine kinase [Hymenobacter profundi]MBW3130405.1 PAS domain-containing sensor histidine kinase [Hymenobacter profundi]